MLSNIRQRAASAHRSGPYLLGLLLFGVDASGCDRAKDLNDDRTSSSQRQTPADHASATTTPPGAAAPADRNAMKNAPNPPQAPAQAFQKDGFFRVDGEMPARIGTLRRNQPRGMDNPSEYCLEDGHIWRGAAYRLDGENIFGVDIDEALAGESVIVYGTSRPSLDSMLEKGDPCPPGYGEQESAMQMRSDWTSPECGFTIGRSTHETLRALSYLQARGVFPLELITRKGDGEDTPDGKVAIEVHNPLAVPLVDAEIVSHYEGGRGKPQPRFEKQSVSLQPGERTVVIVPRSLPPNEGQRRRFRLYDVALTGKAGRVRLRAEVSAR